MNKYIYTPATHRAAKAIFDNGAYTLRVEVNKVAGTAMYTYFINGKADHNVTRIDAVSSWEDVADWLGAELIITEQKQLTKQFEDYKIWVKEAKETRKRVKEGVTPDKTSYTKEDILKGFVYGKDVNSVKLFVEKANSLGIFVEFEDIYCNYEYVFIHNGLLDASNLDKFIKDKKFITFTEDCNFGD